MHSLTVARANGTNRSYQNEITAGYSNLTLDGFTVHGCGYEPAGGYDPDNLQVLTTTLPRGHARGGQL